MDKNTVQSGTFWALIELMGQRKAVGLCSWHNGGTLNVNLLKEDGHVDNKVTTFGPCALYRVTPVEEEVAVATAKLDLWDHVSRVPDWAVTPKPKEEVPPRPAKGDLVFFCEAVAGSGVHIATGPGNEDYVGFQGFTRNVETYNGTVVALAHVVDGTDVQTYWSRPTPVDDGAPF